MMECTPRRASTVPACCCSRAGAFETTIRTAELANGAPTMSRHRSTFVIAFAAAPLLAAAPATAHHSPAAFDMLKQVTIAGTVTSFEWANPHAYVSVTDDADGRTWLIELVSPSNLKQYGWTPATLAKGDRVTITASPARNAARSTAYLQSIEKAGSVLYVNPRPVSGAPPPGSAPNAAAGVPSGSPPSAAASARPNAGPA